MGTLLMLFCSRTDSAVLGFFSPPLSFETLSDKKTKQSTLRHPVIFQILIRLIIWYLSDKLFVSTL